MTYRFGKLVVISLGGSIVFPKNINVRFLKNFQKLVNGEVKQGRKFIIVVGGGCFARVFQDAAEKLCKISDEEKDWIGIRATRLPLK